MSDLEKIATGLVELALSATGKSELSGTVEESLALIVGLFERVAKLEQRPMPKYLGPWHAKGMYDEGALVSHDGSLWHANESTDARPGCSAAWTLCVKRGRDARPRKATAPRNGHHGY